MIRITLTILAVVAAAAFLAATAGARSAGLTGEVGPGFTIEVKKGNTDLKTIRAGMYRIKIEDKSSLHNFHLIGPGINKKTSVAFKGELSWTIRLKPGRYTYQCDPHAASGMKGNFRVTR
jgi:plastocyanin